MLQVNDVHAGYGNLKILRGVDMSISDGGIVTLLGVMVRANRRYLR